MNGRANITSSISTTGSSLLPSLGHTDRIISHLHVFWTYDAHIWPFCLPPSLKIRFGKLSIFYFWRCCFIAELISLSSERPTKNASYDFLFLYFSSRTTHWVSFPVSDNARCVGGLLAQSGQGQATQPCPSQPRKFTYLRIWTYKEEPIQYQPNESG